MIKKYRISKNSFVEIPKNVSCIGFFDGVHLGHQALIKKTVELAKEKKVKPFLITFYPDPADIISSKKTKHINTLNRRIELFEKFEIDSVIIIEFDKEVMSIDEKEFTNLYLKNLNLKGLVCGYDFHYGYKGLGDHKTLKKEMKEVCPVYMVDEVKYYGKKVSSTRIKEEIEKKNYKLVDKLLGYKYQNE